MEVVQLGFEITDRSGIAEARRRAMKTASLLGFSEEASGRAAIVTTELATNLWTHGQGGWCFAGRSSGRVPTIDIVVADRGPGIRDPGRALRDGYTTGGGTPGTGLGAVLRLSQDVQFYTRADQGLVCLARVADRIGAPIEDSFRFCSLGIPRRGEQVSGDSAAARSTGTVTQFMMADGLGHGFYAAAASGAAVAAFDRRDGSPLQQVEQLHDSLRSTRGAAIAIAEIDLARGMLEYSGIGNIAARIDGPEGTSHLPSMNGTAGHVASTLRQFSYPAPPGGLLIMHSDGISARWDLDRYPGLRHRDPAVIAAVVFRDFARGHDDATVLVARLPESPAGRVSP